MFKKFFLLFFIILFVKNIAAQTNDNYSIIAEGSTGKVLLSKDLVKDFSYGFSAEIQWQTLGLHAWEHYLNYPSIGFGARFMTLGNSKFLGNMLSAYPYMRFSLIKSKIFKADLQTGIGLAFLNKYYSNTPHTDKEDPLRIAPGMNGEIGTMLNVFFTIGFGAEVPINKGLSIRAEISGNHASNGNLGMPNHGVNIINSMVGLKLSPNWNKYLTYQNPQNPPDLPRNMQYELTLSGGLRNLLYFSDKMYPMASLAFAAYKPMTNWHRVGLGVDFFYSGIFSFISYPWQEHIYMVRACIDKYDLKNMFRAGVSFQNEILIGKLIAGFHVGVYFYDNIKNYQPYLTVYYRYLNGEGPLHRPLFYKYHINEQDGWCYGRVVGKYSFSKHLFAAVGIKTHLFRADFIEFGLGYKF